MTIFHLSSNSIFFLSIDEFSPFRTQILNLKENKIPVVTESGGWNVVCSSVCSYKNF